MVKPMATAPRDGTTILLLFEEGWIEGEWNAKKIINDGHDTGRTYGTPEWEVVTLSSHGCGCCGYPNGEALGWTDLPKVEANQ